MTVVLPTCLMLLLQGPVSDQCPLNRVDRLPWSRHSSALLPTPHPPLPQTATPHWRRKMLLPSVGPRWSSCAGHSNFPLSFFPLQQLLPWFSNFGFFPFLTLSNLLLPPFLFFFTHARHSAVSSDAFHPPA